LHEEKKEKKNYRVCTGGGIHKGVIDGNETEGKKIAQKSFVGGGGGGEKIFKQRELESLPLIAGNRQGGGGAD